MKGLLLKDFYNLKKYSRTAVLVLLAYGIIFGVMGNNVSFVSSMATLMAAMMSISSFAYDDASKWDQYAASLPLRRKDIVKSKYVLGLILCTLGGILGLFCTFVFSIIQKSDFVESLLTIYVTLLIGILFVSVVTPLVYKFGTERSRVVMILTFLIPFAIVMGYLKLELPLPTEETIKFCLMLAPFFVLVILIISYFLSCAIFNKKEL